MTWWRKPVNAARAVLKGLGFLWVLLFLPGVLLAPYVLWHGLNEPEGQVALGFMAVSLATMWVFDRVTKRPPR